MRRSGDPTGRREGLATPENLTSAPRIWAVGGGKGGVGKSLVLSSLACAIAGAGRRCTVIDADLGGANLHTLLGVAPPRRTLSHFLSGEVSSLSDLMVPTSVPNLSLVSADKALLDMANPRHCQKEKLLRHVRGLDVDEVLLDLGGGSAFNVLDGFLVAQRGIVVVTPEPTAIENAEHFLRAAFYRSLRTVTRHPEVRAAILRVKEDRAAPRVSSAPELIARVRHVHPPAAKLLAEQAQAFAPLLLVNQVESTAAHRQIGPELAQRCRERLGVSIDYVGCLHADPLVREAVARRQPATQLFSHSTFPREIDALATRLLREAPEILPERGEARPTRSLPPLDLDRPGAYLRRCRDRLGLTLPEMTERTRIQGLCDIESEHFGLLPPEPYLRGFLLSYARELGISELEALTASYLDRYRGVEAA
ncbi:MAG: P-loop NTPase [Myxococcota bacterium]